MAQEYKGRSGEADLRDVESEILQVQQRFLDSLRLQRHDWLNHFQVILGYMKLQRYDVCEEYIKKVTDQTNNESRIAALEHQALVAYLLTYNAIYKEMKLEVLVPELINLGQLGQDENKRFFDLVKGIIDTYREHSITNNGLPNTLVIELQELEESIFLAVEYEGNLREQECIEALRSLASRLGDGEGFFVEGLHNDQESIMEFYFPVNQEVKE
ncbi:Spo0B domain-containing protein [Ammoniphilus sp. CFH 90114]|uniref:Spo0B domain-containing protein n=1 Tax=Ammoniphilus sp. CFH 90114 TaxID=2493665 RepID=UPI0013E911F7|nr:Spo0B domain-containing protein [Ammoniphilus sp. CFH 90114]